MAIDTDVVKILHDGTVDKQQCVLSKAAKHRILWVSEATHAYRVSFEGGNSPFHTADFHVDAGGWAESKDIIKGAGQYTYHTYDVGTGQLAADPVVIIQE